MLHRVLDEIRGKGLAPSLSCTILRDRKPVFSRILPKTAERDPVYDIASLTKPLLTFPLVHSVLGNLDHKLIRFLPDTKLTATLRQLAGHTAGLKAWLPLYLYDTPYLETIEVHGTGASGHAYSCMGPIVLARALARATDTTFDLLSRDWIRDIPGCECPPGLHKDVQPTERGNRHEQKMAADFFTEPDPNRFRLDTLIHGEVHDLNAFYDGGISGNAGLFATAQGCGELAIRLTELSDWQLPMMKGKGYFYHMGFTGTGLAISPDRRTIVVFLSNRVHPEVKPIDFSKVRHRVFQAALAEFA